MYNEIEQKIKEYNPDCIAIEELFFNTNITTGIQVGHARGVIMLAGHQKGVEFNEYTPLQVKQSVVGYGRAEKRQVMEMTRQLLGLEKIPRPDDAADALALAKSDERVAPMLEGMQIVKELYVPGKLVNIVVKPQ